MSSQKILVVGAGQMGAGIAQVAAQAGYEVMIVDTAPGAKDRALGGIQKSLAKLVEKKLLAESVETVSKRIQFSESLAAAKAFAPALAVEAVTENFELKAKIFRELDALLPANAILASNTSSISITRIAAVTKRPAQVVGVHFMNPVPLMKLVELIRGLATSDEVFAQARKHAEAFGKTCVESKDKAGFIINRILMPMINEAAFVLEEGLATAADIDTGMKLGTNQPMGPLQLADFIGLDTCLAIMEVLHEGLGDDKYRPSPLLRQYVTAGWLGKKSGRGFYSYNA